MAKVCIICEKEPQEAARKVKDDAIIKAIRAAKQRLGIARNNELYVCEGCMPKYVERRKKFERNIVFYVALGVIIFVLINGLQLMGGVFSITAFIASVFLAILIVGLAVLNYATPPLEGGMPAQQPAPQAQEKPEARKARPPARRTGKGK